MYPERVLAAGHGAVLSEWVSTRGAQRGHERGAVRIGIGASMAYIRGVATRRMRLDGGVDETYDVS